MKRSKIESKKSSSALNYNRNHGLEGVLVAMFALLVLVSSAQAKYSGSGTPEEPFLISTPAEMNDIDNNPDDLDKYFLLTNDIDLSVYTGEQFNIIYPFTGVFDGNDHTISNFIWSSTRNLSLVGLFCGLYDSNAVIKDLGLIDPNIDLLIGSFIGVLVGYVDSGTVSNCYVQGGSIRGEGIFGGLVGQNNGNISDCYATCTVTGTGNEYLSGIIGGLVGWNENGTIENSYATSIVSSESSYSDSDSFGGLVGANEGAIINCYATGSISGNSTLGGLVGYNYGGTITNCYTTGNVSGAVDVGGLVGWNDATATNSFWDVNTSGQDTSAGGTGKTTAEMQDPNTFLDAGWDFVGEDDNGTEYTWRLCVDGTDYPRLSWQFLLGDFLCPDGVNFVDYSFFSDHWDDEPCDELNNHCDGTDLDEFGTVDFSDQLIFSGNWLEGF